MTSNTPHDSRRRLGWLVAASLITGLVAAGLLVAAPFIPVEEAPITGALLSGFAAGWATLFLLSHRLTDQPQRWTAGPAVFMGVGGLVLIAFGSRAERGVSWVWPPALLALVVWMVIRVRHELRGRGARSPALRRLRDPGPLRGRWAGQRWVRPAPPTPAWRPVA